MKYSFDSFTAQTWSEKDWSKVHDDILHLSIDAAREIAVTHHLLFGFATRIMSEQNDYCEVWDSSGKRTGTFGETTLVTT